MRLRDYITQIGDEAAARLFGLSQRAVKSYRLGDRRPRPERARQIINRSGGRVDWAGIYSDEREH